MVHSRFPRRTRSSPQSWKRRISMRTWLPTTVRYRICRICLSCWNVVSTNSWTNTCRPASIGAISLQKVPLNGVCRIEGPVWHLRSGRWENGDVTRVTWPECGIRHSRPSNPLRQTALRVWTGWFRSKLVQILPNQPNNLCSLQRADIRSHLHSLRRATGIGAWSNPLHSLRGRSHQHSRQTRICCSLLRQRPLDLRPLASIFLRESGGANVELCRGDWWMDGQQSTQAQPFKDGADLAWIFSAAGALPGWWTQHRWGTHQAGYARPWPRRHDWQRSVVASSHQPRYTNLLLPSASTASRPAFSHDRYGSLPSPSSCAQPARLLQWSSRRYVSVPDRSASICSSRRSSPRPQPTQVSQRFGRYARQTTTLAPLPRKGPVQTL